MSEVLLHAGFVCTLFVPLASVVLLSIFALTKRAIVEAELSIIVRVMAFSYLCSVLLLVLSFAFCDERSVRWALGGLNHGGGLEIECDLFLDRAGAVFLLATAMVTNIIVFFSRRYLHRDPGFRRFFLVLSLFLFGLTLLFCAGSFDFIFAAWEIVGLSSFLLIAYYWHRPAAVINAKRAYFIYRFCDVGLLSCALLSHLIWHDPNLFYNLSSGMLMKEWGLVSLSSQWLLCLLILLPVLGKSAQFPLSYWLPRAMEGPTPSSAIFYGSLSIHAGVFLLIRTSSIWYHTPGFCWFLASVGIVSAVFATLFGRVQTSIKGQIGYASIAQVGLMLVELSLGLWNVVLIHFVGNAFLRCFQLLVSSSIVSEQLQIHGALDGKLLIHRWSMEKWIPKSLQSSLYVFALNEGYCEVIINKCLSQPVQRLAVHINKWARLLTLSEAPSSTSLKSVSLFPVFALGLVSFNFLFGPMSSVSVIFMVAAALLSLSALAEEGNAMATLHRVSLSHLSAVLAMTLNQRESRAVALLFVVGFVAAWLLVYDVYRYVLAHADIDQRKRFLGLYARFPLASGIGLIGVLGLIGFPLATTFFAEDIILEHAVKLGHAFIFVLLTIFVLNGITMMRLHARLFYGSREGENDDTKLDFSSLRAASRLAFFALLNGLGFAFF